jgi:penicillin-binding protein 1C
MKTVLKNKNLWMLVILVAGILIFWSMLPHRLFRDPVSYVLEDKDGNLLSATIASDGQWRFPDNRTVPSRFATCILEFEDRRFYYHPGVDLRAIGRAVLSNIRGKGNTQGGSTITMQVIRLSSHHTKRTVWNKIKEAVMALRLEFSSDKDEILSVYTAHAPFGSNVVGLDAAAWRYFGRPPSQLSWAECATLAVLPNSPGLIHPGKNRTMLLIKRNRLLDELYRNKKISAADLELAKAEPLPDQPLPLPQLAPQLLTRIKNENNAVGGLRVRSTIDKTLQQNLSSTIAVHHSILKTSGINNLCALVVEVETGKAIGYVGNVKDDDPSVQTEVDIINAPRSPGSALKPILYAGMMSDGMLMPRALIPDIPTAIAGYSPRNFDLNYDGVVPADKALARSLNIPAVRLLRDYKYQRFYGLLKQLGLTSLTQPADFYGLSLILGGSEVRPWDLAGIYASLARCLNHADKNRGMVKNEDFHNLIYSNTQKKTATNDPIGLDPTSIYFAFEAMQEVMRPGEEGLWQQFSSSQKIAWKTGTSFGFRDAWAVGITPKYVVLVWAGNANGEGRTGLTGVQTAAPVMFDIFRLLPTGSWFKKPAYNYSRTAVCKETGFRANIDCPVTDTIYAPPNAEQSPLCPYHKIIHLDSQGYQVNSACADVSDMIHQSWFVLPPTMEYYYRQHHADYKQLPPFKSGCQSTDAGKQMEIIYPELQSRIFVPIEITGNKGRTVFTATHRNKDAKIFWSIDDEIVGETEHFHQLAVDPSPGVHVLTITDNYGNNISRRFEIITKEP